MVNEKCKGCSVYEEDCYLCQLSDPTSQKPITVEECPCIECIVKVMCEQACSEFKTHIRNVKGGTTVRVIITAQRRSKNK